jgi:hypothetical protein
MAISKWQLNSFQAICNLRLKTQSFVQNLKRMVLFLIFSGFIHK